MVGRILINSQLILCALVCTFVISSCFQESSDELAQTSRLSRGLNVEPESLDPHRFASNSAANVLRDIGEGLLSYSANGDLIAGVAESWDVFENGTTYEFKLRRDARWSNGDPVTAADFVFSLRRLVDPATASPYAGSLSIIRNAAAISRGDLGAEMLGVESVDKYTLRLTLSAPAPYLVQLLTHPSTFPVHRESVESLGALFTRPGNFVSNGPYVLSERIAGSKIGLERNLSYWAHNDDGFDEVDYFVVQESAEINLFRAGQLDITANIDGAMFRKMLEERPSEVRVSPYLGVYYYGFNLKSEIFADAADLRRALSMAVDRQVLVSSITGRGEEPAFGWVPPGIAGYTSANVEFATMTKETREKVARELYAKSGYDENRPLRFELRYNTSGVQTRIASALQSMWREVLGAEVTLINEEFSVLLSNIEAMRVTEMFRLSWTGDYNDPLTFLQLFRSDDPSNLTGFTAFEVDELLSKASVEQDVTKRMEILARVEKIAMSMDPVIPLYFYVSKHLVRGNVAGWQDNILDIHSSQYLSPRNK